MSRNDGTDFRPRPRVRWLAPHVLARGALAVFWSGLFGRFSDRREVEAVLDQGIVDLSGEDELWVDYVADTGDGFDATSTVASLLAPPELDLPAPGGGRVPTRAGSLLVLGGDQVYPFASVREYVDRFVGPFRAALPASDPARTMVAIPGNHDWYDGLTAFLQVFCAGQWIGGWRTVQRRSYVACKLPQRWWLWAIDIQLDTYIDQPQLDYFRCAAEQVAPGDGIILCWAKPSWVEAGEDKPQAYETLAYFQRHVVPGHAHVRLSLTGDSHHYARYEGPDGEQKITAGMGGAFLAATHHLPAELQLPARRAGRAGSVPATYRRRCTYPTAEASRAHRWRVVGEMRGNTAFGALPAAGYAALAASLTRRRGRAPRAAAVAGGLVAALVAFSRPRGWRDWGPGALHGVAHLAAASTATALARRAGWRRPAVVAAASGAGAAAGPFLFGLYLVAADRLGLFGRNVNELFAAQAIESDKGFLRLHVRPDGVLVVHPVKVAEVHRWSPDGSWPEPLGGPRFRPDRPLNPSLVEPPVEVTREP